jgi:hypothetical protein
MKKETTLDEINKQLEELRIRSLGYQPETSVDIKPVVLKTSFIQKIKDKFFPGSMLMINMELVSGDHKHFRVIPVNNKFNWKKGSYIVDESLKYYDITYKMYCLDYHESICLPLKRMIDPESVKKELFKVGISDVDNAINPVSLKTFVESNIVQQMIKGADIDNLLNFLRLMIILVCIISGVHLILFVVKSGMLSNMHIPGIN